MPIREDRKGQGNWYIVDTGLGVTQFSKWFPSSVSTPSVLWAMLSSLCLIFCWTKPGVTFATSNNSTFLTQDKVHAQVYRTLWLRLSFRTSSCTSKPPHHVVHQGTQNATIWSRSVPTDNNNIFWHPTGKMIISAYIWCWKDFSFIW